MKTVICVVTVLGLVLCGSAQAGHQHDHFRANDYGPLSLGNTHTHKKGGWMFAYRAMFMGMAGNREGTRSIGSPGILANYPIAPTDMNTVMHMFGGMYAPTELLTLMVMFPYIERSMDHVTRTGSTFATQASGIGDLKVSALMPFWKRSHHQVHGGLELGLPTGSINRRDVTPMGPNQRLPYPMQLGSGTVDILPSLSYMGKRGHWSWGAQGSGVIRSYKNANNYRLGDEFGFSAWGGRLWFPWFGSTIHLRQRSWFDIAGSDPLLNAAMTPTADPNLRGGTRLDLLFGLDFAVVKSALKGLHIAVEGGLPLFQSLDGPQVEMDWVFVMGLRYSS